MNTTTLALLLLAGTTAAIGLVTMLKGAVSSPEGFEDADGFHYGRPEGELAPVVSAEHSHTFEHQTAA